MLFGQIFKISYWWQSPLYFTTPFHYYNEISHSTSESYTYTWVDTKEGRFVYNAISGEYVKEIDSNENPAVKYYEDQKLDFEKRLEESNNSDEFIECAYDKYNCGDFSTCSEVMKVFNECNETGYGDIHYLDGDDDGVPCERYQGTGVC